MDGLQIFRNEEFGEVRTLQVNNEPWFVGNDVARALGYGEGKSLPNAVKAHVDNEDKGVTKMMTPGGNQQVTIINESGLYSLILSSKLPTAKRFKKWVTSEVLPSIRKTAGYVAAADNDDAVILHAMQLLQQRVRDGQGQLDVLKKECKRLADMADFAEQAFRVGNCINISTCAKVLGLPFGARKLYNKLRERGVFFADRPEPKQKYVDAGYFVMKEYRLRRAEVDLMVPVTYATQKGLAYIGYLFGKKPNAERLSELFANGLIAEGAARTAIGN